MYSVEDYINGSKMQLRDVKEVVEEFHQEIKKMNGKVIDIGCGPGCVTTKLLLPALSPEAKLVGADVSPEMLKYAKEKHNNTRLSFISLNIEDLPDNEIQKYDNAISLYCLHWCKDIRLSFKNIYKLLRPGGEALTTFLAYNSGFDAYVRMNQNPKFRSYTEDASRYVPYFQNIQDARLALREMLKDIGFEILHCSKREKTYLYEDKQTFRRHIIAVNPFIRRVPEDMKDEFVDTLLQEVMKQKIIFSNIDKNHEEIYSILDRYDILIAHIKKPVTD